MTADAYIVESVRTAGGRRNGRLANWHPADLAAEVLNAVVDRSGIDPAAVEDVILGCVTQAGEQSFAFARNAVLASKLPESVPAVTIDRQCGSSQQAVQFAAQSIMSGTQDVVIAAGAESMTRVPMFSNLTLHQKAGIGTGPISDRIKDAVWRRRVQPVSRRRNDREKIRARSRKPGPIRLAESPTGGGGRQVGRVFEGNRSDSGHESGWRDFP